MVEGVTHNTRIDLDGEGRAIQTYAIYTGRRTEVRLDLNGNVASLLDMTTGDTERLIAVLQAALNDAHKED